MFFFFLEMDSREHTDGIFVPIDPDLSDAILEQNSNICQICPKVRTNFGEKFGKDGVSFEIGDEEVFVKTKKENCEKVSLKSVEIEVHRPKSFKVHLLHRNVQVKILKQAFGTNFISKFCEL